MPSATLNMLLDMVATPSPAAGQNAANTAEGDGLEQVFADLLSGMNSGGGQDTLTNFGSSQWLAANPSSALAAQEVETPSPLDLTLDSITIAPAQRLVTAQDVPQILQKLEQVLKNVRGATETPAFQQLKEQLNRIVTSGAPKTVEQIVQAVPAARELRISTPALVALLSPPQAQAPTDTPQPEEGAAQGADELWQSMQAAMFRPDTGETAPTPRATQPKPKTKEAASEEVADVTAMPAMPTLVVMQPLAASVTVTMPVTPMKATELPEAAATDDTAAPIPDLDAAIPPLTSGLESVASALPEVTLPMVAMPSAMMTPTTPAPMSEQSLAVTAPISANRSALAAMDEGLGAPAENTNTQEVSEQPVAGDSFADMMAASADKPMATNATANLTPTTAVPVQMPAAHAHASAAHSTTLQLHATPGYVNQAPVTEQVHVAIEKAAKDGNDRILIQLEPLDLGRVEVSMHTNREGVTQVHFTIDKPETFDSLSRDARYLERSLQEAGIKADTGSMQFNLRQQPQQQQNLQADVNSQGQGQQQAYPQTNTTKQGEPTAALTTPISTQHYLFNIREGVDISA